MARSSKQVLITGGAGFIGLHLARALLAAGYRVTLCDDFSRGRRDEDLKVLVRHPRVRILKLDLTNPRQALKLGSGYDHVYHLAAVNGTANFYDKPHEVLRINTMTLVNVLDWFVSRNRSGKILFTSSNEAYAGAAESFNKLPLPTPEDVPLVISDPKNPRWTYAATKLLGELFFIHYAQQYKFRMSIVRPHNFYGPRAGYQHVIPELIHRINRKVDPFPIYGADQTRSFCYIDDAVAAMRLVMESKKTDGGTYHIGSTEETRIADLAGTLFRIAEQRPGRLVKKASPVGSVKRRLPDVRKIYRDTTWKAQTSLEDGLRATYAWYLKNPAEKK